jgi:hypothetical protein
MLLDLLSNGIRGLENEIRVLKRQFETPSTKIGMRDTTAGISVAMTTSLAASVEQNYTNVKLALADYTKHDRCAHNNSSYVMSSMMGNTVTAEKCAQFCNSLPACSGFQFFNGSKFKQSQQGCFYLQGDNGTLQCDWNADAMPKEFAIYIRTTASTTAKPDSSARAQNAILRSRQRSLAQRAYISIF